MEEISVLLLAGSRAGPDPDPVAAKAGLPHKALVPVAGRPMIAHVLTPLLDMAEVRHVVVTTDAPDQLREVAVVASAEQAGRLSLMPSGTSPSRSILDGLAHPQAILPVLIVTADAPLLTAEMVRWFWAAVPAEADAAAAVARGEDIRARFPHSRRTFLRFHDGDVSGCNLFALKSPAAHRLVAFWRRLEEHRKRPLKMAALLGPGAILRYLLGLLSLQDAARLLSRRAGARAALVPIPFPEAAVDVDKPEDLPVVEDVLAERRRTGR